MIEIEIIDYCDTYSLVLFKLHKRFKEELSSIRPDIELMVDDSQYESFINHVSRDSSKNKILTIHGEVKGYVIAYPVTTCDPDNYVVRTYIIIEEVYVEPDSRNHGYASEMITTVMEEYKQEGYQHFQLYVLYDNEKARNLYFKLGFTPQGMMMEQ